MTVLVDRTSKNSVARLLKRCVPVNTHKAVCKIGILWLPDTVTGPESKPIGREHATPAGYRSNCLCLWIDRHQQLIAKERTTSLAALLSNGGRNYVTYVKTGALSLRERVREARVRVYNTLTRPSATLSRRERAHALYMYPELRTTRAFPRPRPQCQSH